jgi:hypothetical protein
MFQCRLHRTPRLWIEIKQSLNQVQKHLVVRTRRWNNLDQGSHRLDVFPGRAADRRIREINLSILEEFRFLQSDPLVGFVSKRERGTYRALLINRMGMAPMTTSIMARCSRLSCVWNKASPVKNSTRMQPIENISHGYDHGKPGCQLNTHHVQKKVAYPI